MGRAVRGGEWRRVRQRGAPVADHAHVPAGRVQRGAPRRPLGAQRREQRRRTRGEERRRQR